MNIIPQNQTISITKTWKLSFFNRIFNALPSEKETQKAQKALQETFQHSPCNIFNLKTVKDFAEGKISKGASIKINSHKLVFIGAYKNELFPRAMVFFDPKMKTYFQFSFTELLLLENNKIPLVAII